MMEPKDTNSFLLRVDNLLENGDADADASDNDAKEFYTIDEFLDEIGQLGRFQILVLVLLSCMVLVTGYQAMFMVFASPHPPWKCSGVNRTECNSSIHYTHGVQGFNSRCSMNRSSWKYVSKMSYSIVTEFDLVCTREVLSIVANSALFIGMILAGFPLAYISDTYGRKPVLFSSFVALCVFSFLTSLSPSIWVVILFRALTGGSFCGMMMTVVVLALELVGPKHRTFAGLIFWNAWTIGLCLLSLQSWLIPTWKILAMITSAPYLVCTLAFFIIPESVRWYRSQNRIEEAEAILYKVARVNKKEYPTNKCLSPVDDEHPTKASFELLCMPLSETLKTLTLCWMWFTNDLNYYGIAMASGDFGGNLHRDFVLFSICEIPGSLFTIWLLDKIGRKKGTLIGYAATSVSLIFFGFLQQFDVQVMVLRVTLGIIAKMFNILAWSATSIWSGELYSTVVRSQAIGLFIIMSQCGSFCSPWIAIWLKNYSISLPFFIFGGFPVVAGCLALNLRETLGESMDDEVVVKGCPEAQNVALVETV